VAAGWLAGWLTGWLAVWLAGWMDGCWMVGWLDGRSAEGLIRGVAAHIPVTYRRRGWKERIRIVEGWLRGQGTTRACGGYNVVEIRNTTSRDLHLAPPRINQPASQPTNRPTPNVSTRARDSWRELRITRHRFSRSFRSPQRWREKRAESAHRGFFRREISQPVDVALPRAAMYSVKYIYELKN